MSPTPARLSYDDTPLLPQRAHDGVGEVRAARVLERAAGPLAFVDLVAVPRGVTIGRHTHGDDDEELYIVVAGRGEMVVDDEVFPVGPGDVVLNRPGGTHELRTVGDDEVRMVVVDLRVPPGGGVQP